MYNIPTRLNSLTQQLMAISKLQKMEQECNICPATACKKCSIHSFGKPCHCAHHIFSFKEQCNKFGCGDKCVSYDDSLKRIPCNSKTCKTRRKLHGSRCTRSAEVQMELKDNEQTSRSIKVDMETNSVSQDFPLVQEKQNSASQSFKAHVSNKLVNTYEEKSEQTIPTKDHFYTQTNMDTSNSFMEIPIKETNQTNMIRSNTQQDNIKEIYYNLEDVSQMDRQILERVQQDLENERERNRELEKMLKNLTCSVTCLQENGKQRAACLKSTETEEKYIVVPTKSSETQTDLIGHSVEELPNEVAKLQQQIIEVAHANTALSQERDSLKTLLQSISEDDARKCEEVEKQVNRMKQAVKEKEDALNKERAEFMGMIKELTNVIKIQKRRVCEVTCVCNNQQQALQEKDKELHGKTNELLEVKGMLETSSCTCKELEGKVEELEYCLCEEKKACNCLKEELETVAENHSSEIRIKDKIIEEQNKTIARQRMLLHDSEQMVQQVAFEFDQLKDELNKERQRNESLQMTLNKTDMELNNAYGSVCQQCITLENEIEYLKKEKQKASAVARVAYQKLHQSVKQYQTRLVHERQQYNYMASIIEKKEQEIGCLKTQLCQYNARVMKRMNAYEM